MKDANYTRIEKQIDSFPSLPTTVTEVMNVVNNPDSSARDLTQAVLPDQSMCVAILKIANSALFGRPKEVSSLESAITVLGFDEIQNIVLSKSVLNSFGSVFRGNEQIINEFWDHSFTCALAARSIAEHFNISFPGRFFIGGLIHDIGKLAMLMTFRNEYDKDLWLSGFSRTEKLEEEKDKFGIDHAEVGGRLLNKWDFPDILVNGVLHHHHPEDAAGRHDTPVIIQLADVLSHICCSSLKDDSQNLENAILDLIPGVKETWDHYQRPWDSLPLEMCYNWISIEREHGSSILSILTY